MVHTLHMGDKTLYAAYRMDRMIWKDEIPEKKTAVTNGSALKYYRILHLICIISENTIRNKLEINLLNISNKFERVIEFALVIKKEKFVLFLKKSISST